MRYRIIILINIVFIFAQGVVHAEKISFRASVDRETISTISQLTYTLTIDGAKKVNPIPPDFTNNGFEIIDSLPPEFKPNSRHLLNQSINYLLMPIKAGTFTIPHAQLEYGGKTYLTKPIKVTVVDGPVPESAPDAQSSPVSQSPSVVEDQAKPQPPDQYFFRTTVNKKEAYVNEQLILSSKFYCRGLNISNWHRTPPSTTGLIKEDLGKWIKFSQIVEGFRYEGVELSEALFPISLGEITIGQAEFKGNVIVHHRSQRRSIFDEFFSERQPFTLRSDPIKLTIKPLPREGRPVDFKGAVGDFRFDLTANPLDVKVGEQITVTMTIAGTGNLDTVSLPHIQCGDAFNPYAPEIGVKRGVRGGRVNGEKIFKQMIIPLSVEAEEIPAVSFSFFNPATGKYRTITKPPILIKVGAAPDQGPVALIEGAGSGPGRERIKLLEKDILYIKENPGRLTRIGQFYYHRPRYWIIPIASLVGLFAIWGIQSRREKLRSDLIYARQVGASRSARKRFKKARTFLNAGDSEKFYGEVHRAFNRYLGDKLGIPSGAVEGTIVAEKLSSAGTSVKIIEEVETCFSDFDLARFARSSSDKKEMEDFLTRVENLISKLEKIKIKHAAKLK